MNEVLYKKVMTGKRTTYVPLPTESGKLDEDLTEDEIISSVAILAVCAIHGYKKMVPRGIFTYNRIKSVEEAVGRMFKETGAEMDDDSINRICAVWDMAMLLFDGYGAPKKQEDTADGN